jgi:hypothetical protein
MTQSETARKFVERLQHDAHLRYQRQQTAPDATTTSLGAMPCSEVRGIRRIASRNELNAVWNPAWMTGLRPNFWKAYFETLTILSR